MIRFSQQVNITRWVCGVHVKPLEKSGFWVREDSAITRLRRLFP